MFMHEGVICPFVHKFQRLFFYFQSTTSLGEGHVGDMNDGFWEVEFTWCRKLFVWEEKLLSNLSRLLEGPMTVVEDYCWV